MSMRQSIALLDCDNFFVSCERLFRPALSCAPVVVLSSNDACVISRSNEAKHLGIRMGEPYFKIRAVCEQNGVQVFSSNFELYRDISQRVMSMVRRTDANVEVYSIDEAFLEFSHTGKIEHVEDETYENMSQLRSTILHEIGIPVSIGVSKTKTLAKIASHHAKPKSGGTGCMVLLKKEVIDAVLERTPVEEVWGVGKRRISKLHAWRIHSAKDLSEQSDAWARKHMSLTGLMTVRELRGSTHIPVCTDTSIRASLVHSQSFGNATTVRHIVASAVAHHARSVAEMLRHEGILGKKVRVMCVVSGGGGGRRVVYADEVLSRHSDDTLEYVKTTHTLFTRLYRENVRYHKAGVMVRDIVPKGAIPRTTLFGEETGAHDVLMRAIDTLRSRFGNVVVTGAELSSGATEAKHEYRSPRYTTRWSEVLRVW